MSPPHSFRHPSHNHARRSFICRLQGYAPDTCPFRRHRHSEIDSLFHEPFGSLCPTWRSSIVCTMTLRMTLCQNFSKKFILEWKAENVMVLYGEWVCRVTRDNLVDRNEHPRSQTEAWLFFSVFEDLEKSSPSRVFNAGSGVAAFSRPTEKAWGAAGPAEQRLRYSPAHLAS